MVWIDWEGGFALWVSSAWVGVWCVGVEVSRSFVVGGVFLAEDEVRINCS